MTEVQLRSMKWPGVELLADLRLPTDIRALVIFAHGSGRLSGRSQYVVDMLASRGPQASSP